ncbi:hypothetical protein PYCCODRAFT_787679 [Trametes coccinea BRFM310]|uniref:Secreted protein n=1 Tax=Trametes coccinea (strain BRFM310) TaxID=1353009 RepID=A0A1Y2J0T5_TRAC3|nr:hypothetical protein PYCCODRAFT_787679 [Trametes coccinea BRFM310]
MCPPPILTTTLLCPPVALSFAACVNARVLRQYCSALAIDASTTRETVDHIVPRIHASRRPQSFVQRPEVARPLCLPARPSKPASAQRLSAPSSKRAPLMFSFLHWPSPFRRTT